MLKAKGEESGRGWDGWIASASMDMNFSKLQEIVKDWEASCAAVLGVTKSWTWLSKWTTTNFSVRGGVGSSVYSFNWLRNKYFSLGSCCTYKVKSCSILKENNIWVQYCWRWLFLLLMACQFVGFPHPHDQFLYLSMNSKLEKEI